MCPELNKANPGMFESFSQCNIKIIFTKSKTGYYSNSTWRHILSGGGVVDYIFWGKGANNNNNNNDNPFCYMHKAWNLE